MAPPADTGPWPEYGRLCRAYYAGALTERDWTAWRTDRLRAVVAHVAGRSPFYRRHLAGIDPDTLTLAGLGALPYTTKADLRRERYAVLCGEPRDALVFYETTGTTGSPTPCPRDARDVATSNLHVEESWRRLFRHHFGKRPPVVALMGPSELYAFGDTFGEVSRRLGGCAVKLWPASPRVGQDTALRLLRELPAEVVVCAPALALELAGAARRAGLDPRRDFAIRLFLLLGEVCTEQFAANAAGLWGARVLPTLYGSQEALAIATGCVNGRLHLSEPNYLVEILDPDTGRVLGGSGTGELCLTMLVDGIKPLIRYRTGDLVTVSGTGSGSGSGCGCTMPGRLVRVHGRVADRLRLGGRTVRPDEVEAAVLEDARGCLGYQLVVETGPGGADRVRVRLRLDPGGGHPRKPVDPRPTCRAVAERVRDRLGVAAGCEVHDRLDPVTGTGAVAGWKPARIVDTRS